MPTRILTLLVLAGLSLPPSWATARALSDAEIATLQASGDDRRSPAWRAAYEKAGALGKEHNLDALPLLLQLRKPFLMSAFAKADQFSGRAPTPELEAMALALARDASYGQDDASWDTRAAFLEMVRDYHSRDLFELLYASVQRDLTARRNGERGLLPLSERRLGGTILPPNLPDIEEPIAALLPLINDACTGADYVYFLHQRHYQPAYERLRDLYLKALPSTPYCDDTLTWALGSFPTQAASEVIVQRIHGLLTQPPSAVRDHDLQQAIGALGPRPVEAQVDLEALERDVLSQPMPPALQANLQQAFQVSKDAARRASTFDTDTLIYWINTRNFAVLQSLLEHGVDPNKPTARGQTPLVIASTYGDNDSVRWLVGAGADVNQANAAGELPLLQVCASTPNPRQAELVSFLLAHGAHVDAQSPDGMHALHYAAKSGSSAAIDVLLANGADINARRIPPARADGAPSRLEPFFLGGTPLHVAANESKTGAAQHLVERGADINARMDDGSTPLLLAAMFNNPPLARYLIAHGANVNLAAKGGVTPIVVAHENGDHELQALLQSKGAFLNPLTLAKRAVVRALLEQYAQGMK